MRLLLGDLDFTDLSVYQKTHNCAMFDDPLKLGIDICGTFGMLLGVLGERLLLRLVPVLVEATLHLVGEMCRPDSGEGAKAVRGLDITNDTDGDNWGGLDDANGLDDFLFVQLGPWFVDVTDDVSHAGLVAHEGSEMAWLCRVILRECLDLSAMTGCALLRKKGQRPVAWGLEFPVRHRDSFAPDRRRESGSCGMLPVGPMRDRWLDRYCSLQNGRRRDDVGKSQ